MGNIYEEYSKLNYRIWYILFQFCLISAPDDQYTLLTFKFKYVNLIKVNNRGRGLHNLFKHFLVSTIM